jgi:hypothetical protein
VQINEETGLAPHDKNIRSVKNESIVLLNGSEENLQKSLKELQISDGSDLLYTTKEEDVNKTYDKTNLYDNLMEEEENMPENLRTVLVQRDDDVGTLRECKLKTKQKYKLIIKKNKKGWIWNGLWNTFIIFCLRNII